jgi:hypothetical protein
MSSFDLLLERPRIAHGIGLFLMVAGIVPILYVAAGRGLLDGAFCSAGTTAFGYMPNLFFILVSLGLSPWTVMMGLSVIAAARRPPELQSRPDLAEGDNETQRFRRIRIEAAPAAALGIGFLAAALLSVGMQASSYYCANPTGVFIHGPLTGGRNEMWTDARTLRFYCHPGKHGVILLDTEVGFLDGAGVQLSTGAEDVALNSFALVESSLQGKPWKIRLSEDGDCPNDLASRLGVPEAPVR